MIVSLVHPTAKVKTVGIDRLRLPMLFSGKYGGSCACASANIHRYASISCDAANKIGGVLAFAQQCPQQLPNNMQTFPSSVHECLIRQASAWLEMPSVRLLVTMHAGLYLSFVAAIFSLGLSVFAIYMALRLPPRKAVSVPQASPTVFPADQSVPSQPQLIADGTVEALMEADANLKKRIIKLATKVTVSQHTDF